MNLNRILIIFLVVLSSCSVKPVPIEYGVDMCNFCKMTIVDPQHGAELVTDKGKVFKFDAIECMVNQLKSEDSGNFEYILINDFSNPGQFIQARNATYLISEEMPSPMGANLNGFSEKPKALEFQELKGGVILNWNELMK